MTGGALVRSLVVLPEIVHVVPVLIRSSFGVSTVSSTVRIAADDETNKSYSGIAMPSTFNDLITLHQ